MSPVDLLELCLATKERVIFVYREEHPLGELTRVTIYLTNQDF